jgi:hypothetical protein
VKGEGWSDGVTSDGVVEWRSKRKVIFWRVPREAFGSGRAKLRLSRGFPLGLGKQCHPQKTRSDYLIIPRLPEQDPNCAISHFQRYANGSTRTTDLRG